MSDTPTWLQALLLAVVQGITEYLPVSSDGHLALLQNTLLPDGDYLFFDIVVHVGTLAALLLYFRRDLRTILAGLLRPGTGDPGSPFLGQERRTALLVAVTTVVTAAAGFSIKSVAESAFRDLRWVAGGFAVTTAYLVASRFGRERRRGPAGAGIADAAIIGLLQAAAVFPGVSRSGGTIAVALLLGLDRDFAARFSFLAGAPAIAGAFLLECLDLPGGNAGQPVGLLLVAGLVSAVIGYASIALLLRLVRSGSLPAFAWYEGAVTILTLFLAAHFGP